MIYVKNGCFITDEDCQDLYEVLIDQGADGAFKIDDISTLQDCMDYCNTLRLENCYSFDYDFDEECCWIFDIPSEQIRLRRNNNVNHYDRKEECYEGTAIFKFLFKMGVYVG